MGRKCSGSRCPMNAATMKVDECRCTDTCEFYTPEITLCSFCRIFPALYEKDEKPCCGFCKAQLDMTDQLSKLREDISLGFKRIEDQILEKK